jgi:ElaB/YqjD/DUF883 family membrane-anchored ribosome-binding protein
MAENELKKEIEELKAQVKSLTQKLEEKALLEIPSEDIEKLNKIKDEAAEVLENFKEKSRQNPLLGITVAAVAGFLIGKMFCGKDDE